MTQKVETKILHEYDFMLVGGIPLAVTLEPALGDTVTRTDTMYSFRIAPRETFEGSGELTSEETVTVMTAHIMALQQRERELKINQNQDWTKYVPEFNDLPPQ